MQSFLLSFINTACCFKIILFYLVRTTWTHECKSCFRSIKTSMMMLSAYDYLILLKRFVCYFPHVSLCRSIWLHVHNGSTSVKFPSIFQCPCAHGTVCVCHSVCECLCVTVYACVTWGHNFASDSFIKCSAASEAAVNQFYLLCVGGQLSWHPQTLTPQEWTGWLLLLQLCCCMLVVKGDLFLHGCGSPEEKEHLL